MYNREIKQRFINEFSTRESVRQVCTSLFNRVARYEEVWGADVCTMGAEDVQKIIDNESGFTTTSGKMPIYVLKRYLRWCVNNNVTGATLDALRIKPSIICAVRKSTVSGPAELQEYLDAVFSDENGGYVDNVFRCFFWLAFSGVFDRDISTIRMSDVSLTQRTIRLDGYSVSFPVEALLSMRSCVTAARFIVIPSGVSTKYISRAEGDMLLRRSKDVKPDIQGIRTIVAKKARAALSGGKTKKVLSYHRVWMSGLFYRKLEEEKFGLEISFRPEVEWMISMDKDATDYQKSSENIRKLARNYMKDYLIWKETIKEDP